MSQAQTRNSLADASGEERYFCGASSVLCLFAWLSVLSLLIGWAVLFLSYAGVWQFSSFAWIGGCFLFAFVAGISSLSPLGGLSAALVVTTLIVFLGMGSRYAG